ncbi:protein of unknown function [Magnetospirillum sp. XM-1]|uniref:hypothetical protein n=1 Tax=Magnetospirillum sp. XM-1 TaxID=1663591 RepID=UPI00073DD5EF|nr:hypothetical protein [Magnetospirillum sp. XM-1]CUW40257.1 protein of unknown function [Magnetospirillum sp. XM-1]
MSTPVTNIPTTISYSVGSSPSTGPFAVPFAFFSTSDLIVYVGSYTPKTIGTDYTVSGTLTGGGYPDGGSVTLTAGVSNTWVVITRSVPIQRVTQLPVSGKFNIDQLNQDLNVSYAIAQQNKTAADNAIHIPVDDYSAAPTTVLPNVAGRAGKGLKFDSSGNVTVTAVDPDDAINTAAASAAAASASASAASASASAASTSASNAATSATNATTNGAAQVTLAAAQVALATTQATNAANSASAAAASAAALPNASAIGSGKVPQSNGTTWTGVTALVSADIGSTVQGYDATTLKSAAIGSTVQGYDATTMKTGAVQTMTKALRGTPVSLTSSSASIATDASASNYFTHTFTENTTLANPSNLAAGQEGVIVFTQHASSPKTLAYGSYWKFSGGTVPSVTATNSAVDVLVYYVESATRITAKLLTDVK